MKKYVSIFMVAVLVISLAAFLNACKGNDGDETTTTEFDEGASINDVYSPWTYEDITGGESVPVSDETPINLPPTSPSSPMVPSTRPVEPTTSKIGAISMETTKSGETTTGRVGAVIVPGTTAPNGLQSAGGTTKPGTGTATTKPTVPGQTETTTAPPVIDHNQYNSAGEPIRPNQTKLEQYVINVINSGKYTMATSMVQDGVKADQVYYRDGATDEMYMKSGLFSVRLVSRNSDYYIIFPTFVSYAQYSTNGSGALEGLSEIGSIGSAVMDYINDTIFSIEDYMKYGGLTSSMGQYCETYADNAGNETRFYFSGSGLTKIEIVDAASGKTETREVKILAGVVKQSGILTSDPFSIPTGYTKVTEDSAIMGILEQMGMPKIG